MSIWGTARDLQVRFEVGQGSSDLYVLFDVGRGSRNLSARIITRLSAYRDLDAKLGARHSVSGDLNSNLVVRPSAFAELHSGSLIRNSSSSSIVAMFFRGQDSSRDLSVRSEIQQSGLVDLYGRFEVGQGSAGLSARLNVARLASENLETRAKVAQQGSADLTSNLNVKQSASQTLLVRFDVGQDAQDLPARLDVGQGSQDLSCLGVIRNVGFSDLKGVVDITHSIDLLGGAVIGHPANPVWLKAIFSVNLTNYYLDLGSILKLRHPSYSECVSRVTVKHTGAPVELSGEGEVRNKAYFELLGGGIIKNVGSAGLMCRFSTQSLGDLYAKFRVPLPLYDSVLVIADDNLAEFLEYVEGVGQGFIGEPSVEDDDSIKMVGENSFKITSNYEAGSYKEVRFGWVFTDLVSLLGSWGIRYAGWESEIIGSYGDRAA